MSPKPTEQHLEAWAKEAFRKAKAYTHFPSSMPRNIERAIARIAYRAGYEQALNDIRTKEQT